MNIEGGISVSAPSVGPSMGPAISGPVFGSSLGGFSVPSMEIGSIIRGPSFSLVNEGPALIGSFENFSPLMPAAPDLGGTIGPIEALNSAFSVTEPKSVFLENTRLFDLEDFSYNPGVKVEIIANPFYEEVKQEETPSLVWETPSRILRAIPDEETQVQLEQVREQIRGLSPKANMAPRVVPTVRVEPSTQPQQAIQVEKILYKKIEEEKEKKKASAGEKKRVELSQRRMIKDLQVLTQRLSDARKAVEKAFNQVIKQNQNTGDNKKTISGQDVEKYIPLEYAGVRGEALKEDVPDSVPDGTYVLGREAIKEIRNTDSRDEMQSKVEKVWDKNYAVERSQSDKGEVASPKQVEDSYMFVNRKPPLRQTFVRMVKEREATQAVSFVPFTCTIVHQNVNNLSW